VPESQANDNIAEHNDQNDTGVVMDNIGMVAELQNHNNARSAQNNEEIGHEINVSDKNAIMEQGQDDNHAGGNDAQPDLPGCSVHVRKHLMVCKEKKVVHENRNDGHDEKKFPAGIQVVGKKMSFEIAVKLQKGKSFFHGFPYVCFKVEDVIPTVVV
jgi:hypothetical protein